MGDEATVWTSSETDWVGPGCPRSAGDDLQTGQRHAHQGSHGVGWCGSSHPGAVDVTMGHPDYLRSFGTPSNVTPGQDSFLTFWTFGWSDSGSFCPLEKKGSGCIEWKRLECLQVIFSETSRRIKDTLRLSQTLYFCSFFFAFTVVSE